MENNNSKIITFSFLTASVLLGFVLSLLIKTFAGAFAWVARLADSDLIKHGVPVIAAFLLFFVLQFNSNIVAWGDEVVSEVKKVVFPSRKDTTAMTIVVIVMVFISAVIITSFDLLSAMLVKSVIN